MYSVTDYTISCWIKGTTGNSDGIFISKGIVYLWGNRGKRKVLVSFFCSKS